MNAKQFLVIDGVVLLILSLLGLFGLTGPTAAQSFFGDAWWFDNIENYTFAIIGVIGLILAYTVPAAMQKWIVLIFGIVGIGIGVYSFFSSNLLGANLENPADSLLFLVLGIWGLIAALMTKKEDLPA